MSFNPPPLNVESPRRRLTSPKKSPKKKEVVEREIIPCVELNEEQKVDMKEVFNIFDVDKNGSIDGFELRIALRALGFSAPNEECRKIMERYTNTRGHAFDALNLQEFMSVIGEQLAKIDPEEEIHKAFELFDKDDKGYLTVEDLKSALNQLGKSKEKTDEELASEIERWDHNKDGKLEYEEFRAIMLNLPPPQYESSSIKSYRSNFD